MESKGFYYPSAIKVVGYSDHQRRAVGRAVRNSALTKKLTDEFCLFFTDMTYLCAWAIHPIYFFWYQAISGHFPRWPPKKLVGTITYDPLDCIPILYSCSLGISDDLINFWNESIKHKMSAAAI